MKLINSYNNSRKYLLLIGLVVVMGSCTKKFSEINTDSNTIAILSDGEIPFLFSAALEGIPFSGQDAQNLFADQYAQYFACNVAYFPTDKLTIPSSWVQLNFDPYYTRVLPQLQGILENVDPNSAEAALCSIWHAFAFHRVTDYWGPIPYFNAGKQAKTIAYDSQKDIYDDFFKRLTDAVAILETKRSEVPFGDKDLMLNGDVNRWIKFANTFRLRLAMRISNVDPERAKIEAEAAYAGGVFTTNDDDSYMPKNSIEQNRLSRMSDYNEFRMSAAMESFLKGYNDPRLPVYFLPAVNSGTYEGLRNGLSTEQLDNPMNSVDANSHTGPRWTNEHTPGGIPDHLSTPQIVLSAAEAYFLRAEGALLNWNMGGTAKELYEMGIETSMRQYGITDATAIQNYINGTSLPVAPEDFLNSQPVADIPVKFNDADAGTQFKQIFAQKWLALYPDGMEAWADFRRARHLELYPVANSDNPDLSDPTTQWIRRIPFLESEKENNGDEVQKALSLLGGPDNISTPLWWDTH